MLSESLALGDPIKLRNPRAREDQTKGVRGILSIAYTVRSSFIAEDGDLPLYLTSGNPALEDYGQIIPTAKRSVATRRAD